ncbi:MAG: isoprenylcysteine carboxylmethyltransferase family protein [Saprospiraceae bacterium]|nr:isoprenylcysteine carboxylmethyltransferase family protein [Saprospiraceae bacterium]
MKGNLYIRNLLFTVLQPGIVVGLFPFLIIQFYNIPLPSIALDVPVLLLILLFISGFLILMYCIYLFIKFGKGTLSPFDPTQELVTSGLYQYSRNPMYLGVITMLIAEIFLFKSNELGIYSLIIFIIFNGFIVLHEEPRLQKEFGSTYAEYKKKVRRWL